MDSDSRARIRELAALFTRLGFTAFGGPAAHVAMMEEEIVTRREWLDHQHFLDLIAAVNFIPGPNSTELAIHVGQLRAGWRGLIVAGVCFICPAMLIILPIAWAYVRWGQLPQVVPALHSIAAAIVAVIAFAIVRFARSALKDGFTRIVFLLVAVGHGFAVQHALPQPELFALAAAAIFGAIWYRSQRPKEAFKLMSIMLPIGFWPEMLRMVLILLKIGATLFGSGYVLITYLQSDLVDHRGWLTQQQLVDAIAVGQFTPGPLLTTATFVGYLLGHTHFAGGVPGGVIAGLAATAAIFLPAFILVAIFGHLLQKIRGNPSARGALDGMNAAVVGLMIFPWLRICATALYTPATHRPDFLSIAIALACAAALWKRWNPTWLIIAAGCAGAMVHIFMR